MRRQYEINEIATMGERLYHEQISKKINPTDRMKYLVIEVESGDYRVDSDEERALSEFESRHPDGWFYFIRTDGAASMTFGAMS
ncbi:MAG: hypothetical protein H8F28_08755 [Fibrella sp.]|nr:hypothetical protein [Armatimonadota bacterium]